MKSLYKKGIVGISIVLAIITWIVTAIVLRSCYPMNTVADKIDTTKNSTKQVEYVMVEVPVYGTILAKENINPHIIYHKQIDTTTVVMLKQKIDSLRSIIKNDVRIEWRLDTIHAVTKDTISVVCEEMNRSILFNFNPALRHVQTERITITNETVITQTRRYGIGVHGGIGIATDMSIKPVLSFGINYIIF